MNKCVLAIGIDPAFADAASLGSLSPDLVRSYVAGQLEQLRKRGYSVESCLLTPGAAAGQVITGALAARKFDCVLIGPGCGQTLRNCCCSKRSSTWCMRSLRGQASVSTPSRVIVWKRFSAGFERAGGRRECAVRNGWANPARKALGVPPGRKRVGRPVHRCSKLAFDEGLSESRV